MVRRWGRVLSQEPRKRVRGPEPGNAKVLRLNVWANDGQGDRKQRGNWLGSRQGENEALSLEPVSVRS